MHLKAYFSILLSLIFLSPLTADQASDETLIRKKTEQLIDAFNRHDAKEVTSLFADDGVYVNPDSNVAATGSAEILKAYESRFKEVGESKSSVKINSITFTSPEEATEIGTYRLSRPNQEGTDVAYKAYFEKKNGNWVIGEIRSMDMGTPPSQYEHLKDLEWLIGDWIDQDDDWDITSTYQWDQFKNFIYQKFSVHTEGIQELTGTQIIGWDPIAKKIRSWIFDSDGGFGEATWTKKDKSWISENVQTLADGSKASSINIFTPVDSDTYTWESTGREVGGKLLPNIAPVTVKKKKG